ncbi:MAG: glycosyltransferase [Armatimonadota bacterium]|nr:glycosyltransferase [Armatimonadota bacterium]MDR7438524.1 glycosyltransferase [Armatimonadota bacterium]MDR7562332.1 glycosyltransferase [Armatimonadota bacterium]
MSSEGHACPRILVLSATYGGGHQRVAEALRSAWAELLPAIQVEIVDFFEAFVNPALNRMVRSLYVTSVRHAPAVWGAFYYATGNIRPDSPTQRLINRLGRQRLVAYLRNVRPALLVHVHPTPAGVVSDLKAEGEVHQPSAVVLTDYAIHSQWIHPHVDRYCVPSEAVRAGLVDRGVPADRIFITGIPIAREFTLPLDRREVAPRLGLDPDRTTVLVMAGAYAMLGGILEIHRVILSLPHRVQAVFICGRDAGLVERLRRRSRRRPEVRVEGYVANVAEWMTCADLLVTKAGGATVSEALAKALPMVIYRPIPGQEEWNTRMLVEAGAARIARNPEELARLLHGLLRDPGELDRMQQAARKAARPNAAREAAQRILELLPGGIP